MRLGALRSLSLASLSLSTAVLLQAADTPLPANSQPETIPFTTPEEALKRLKLPDGFHAQLFAAEPQIRQPIGLTTDARGRVWVAENDTYAESAKNFDAEQRDRIVILADSDGDGRADRRTIFQDQLNKLTSVEVGLGGVWALCPPNLYFIPDRDGDDRPDGPPEIVLDGFDDAAVRHNIANGLRWGPDGWLYGRHGILATSLIGPPGSGPEQRAKFNCAIWRYHPTRKVAEAVAQGTTNSWGMDWDQHGELFFINTVIGHLWHVVPGAFYQRMYGEHFNPHLYQVLSATSDHFHWDTTSEVWHDIRQKGVTPGTDAAGGGHAHCGLLIYQETNWPAQYRNKMYTINFHGLRVNSDRIERHGATYVGRHDADILKTTDPWFRGIDLVPGHDGAVYMADWSDIGECHDNDGIHRTSGRIFRIGYGQPKSQPVDLTRQTDAQLVDQVAAKSEWFVRQARQQLRDRFVAGNDLSAARKSLSETLASASDPLHQLRALWSLQVTGGVDESLLLKLLDHPNEHLRVWAIQLLLDHGRPQSAAVLTAFVALARGEQSGLVLTYLASALQKLPVADRWDLAGNLCAKEAFASDAVYPLMVWYGVEPAVTAQPEQAVALARSSQLPMIRSFIARRLAADVEQQGPALAQLGTTALRSPATAGDILDGITAGLKGRRKAPAPPGWMELSKQASQVASVATQEKFREISVVFGDGRALDELRTLAVDGKADLDARRRAIEALAEARADNLLPLLSGLFGDTELSEAAVRGLAAVNEPAVAETILKNFGRLRPPGRAAAIDVLASRPASAGLLLTAVAEKKVPADLVQLYHVRQMYSLGSEDLQKQLEQLWPAWRPIASDKAARIKTLGEQLTADRLAAADPGRGRVLFDNTCAKCHRLFGAGQTTGPELTGAQRSNLTYLLENIVDPSATLAANYRVSVVTTQDGRVLTGVVGERTARTITLQTPTDKVTLQVSDIDEMVETKLSLMPEGMLDQLKPDQIADLIRYLQSTQQVDRPAE